MKRWLLALVAMVAALAMPSGQIPTVGAQSSGGPVVIRGHATGLGADVSHANALMVELAGASAITTLAHITSVTHVAGSVSFAAGSTVVANQGTAGNAAWPVTAHQGGAWTTAHVTSVTHVAIVADFSQAGASNQVCHSRANFVTTANAIVAHGKAGLRLYICAIFLVADGLGTDVSLVEGTGAACVTGIAPVLGSTVATVGMPLGYHAFSLIEARPWISTATAGNQLCVLTSSAATRVVGAITYGAY